MPRDARLAEPGDHHHVCNRVGKGIAAFHDLRAQRIFVALLPMFADQFGIHVLSWCLMDTHYHLLLHDPDGNLSAAMQRFGQMLSQRINRLYGWDGPLWRGRFCNRVVSDARWLQRVFAYIALNPYRAGAVRHPDVVWPSAHRALAELEPAPDWLAVDRRDPWVGDATTYRDFVLDEAEREPSVQVTLHRASTGRLPGRIVLRRLRPLPVFTADSS